jgi:hypothetical protein
VKKRGYGFPPLNATPSPIGGGVPGSSQMKKSIFLRLHSFLQNIVENFYRDPNRDQKIFSNQSDRLGFLSCNQVSI